jgi:hypothetical protein
VVHEPLTDGLMPMRSALIVPVWSADPVAWTHTPTFRSAGLAATASVYVVALSTSTVSVTVAPLCRSSVLTSMVGPVTDVTVPLTAEPKPAPGARLRLGVPLGRGRGGRPAPANLSHEPFSGRLITTVVAVIVRAEPAGGPEEEPPAATAVMQEPAAIADSDTVAVRVNEVVPE